MTLGSATAARSKILLKLPGRPMRDVLLVVGGMMAAGLLAVCALGLAILLKIIDTL